MLHLSFPAAATPRRIGLALTLAMHALALLALLSYAPTRQALLEAAPIMVNLLASAPPRVESPPPRPKPVAPVPRSVRAREPLPLLAAPVETSTSTVVVTQPPAPLIAPPIAAPPAPPELSAPPPALPVTPPVFDAAYLHNPAPPYPAISRRMGEEGRVILRVLVNPSGAADDIQVHASSGSPRLDESARDTVRRWKFVPARRGQEAVAAWVLIPISFRLER